MVMMVATMAQRNHNEIMVVRPASLRQSRSGGRDWLVPATVPNWLFQAEFHLALFRELDVQHLFFSADKFSGHSGGLLAVHSTRGYLHP